MIVFVIIIVSFLAWGIITLISEASNLLSGLNEYFDKFNELLTKILYDGGFSKNSITRRSNKIIDNSSLELLEFSSNYIKQILNSFLDSVTCNYQ